MGGEDHALADAAEAVDDPRQPLRPDVRLAVDRRGDVAARLELVPSQHGRALARDRREAEARVGHHVADDVDPAADSLAEQRLARALVGAEEELRPRRRPRSGCAPPASRGRRCGARPRRARPGRRRRPPPRSRRASSSCRRRRASSRAAPARSPPRSPAASSRRRRCAGRAGSAARGSSELLVEDVGEVRIPVLPGVEADLLDAGVARARRRAGRT